MKLIKLFHHVIESWQDDDATEKVISSESIGWIRLQDACAGSESDQDHAILDGVSDVVSATPHEVLREVSSTHTFHVAADAIPYLDCHQK